jgi:hypothetical protein
MDAQYKYFVAQGERVFRGEKRREEKKSEKKRGIIKQKEMHFL